MGLGEIVKKIEGFDNLYEHQEAAITEIEKGNSILLVAPTAAGKTVVAKAAILASIMERKKAIYMSPLVALSNEKFSEFKEFFEKAYSLGCIDNRPGIAFVTGNITRYSRSNSITESDILVTSFEKLDSLLSKKFFTKFVKSVQTIVIDEIHVLYDENRGSTVEKVVALLKYLNPDIRIVGLSATVGNPETISKWLDATLIKSNFRPVKLERLVYAQKDGKLYIFNGYGDVVSIEKDKTFHKLPIKFVTNMLENNKQGLIFVASRKFSEGLARELSGITSRYLNKDDVMTIEKALEKIPDDSVSRKVAKILKYGVAFHHSGLPPTTRKIIEDLFRERAIKLIVATPGLSAGVNLPAAFVIVRDIYRFNGRYSKMISAFEVQQMLGRAGRPQFEKTGTAVIVTDISDRVEQVAKKYYFSGVEAVDSPLMSDFIKSDNLLSTKFSHFALQAMRITSNVSTEAIRELFKRTFGSTQLEEGAFTNIEIDKMEIEQKIKELYDRFVEEGFIKDGELTPDAHISLDAYLLPSTIKHFEERFHENMSLEEFISAVLSSPECQRSCNIRVYSDVDVDALFELADKIGADAFSETDHIVKVMLVMDWISGKSEDELYETYSVAPGDLWGFIMTLQWVVWAALEYAELKGLNIGIDPSVAKSIEYGVPLDAVELLDIPMIGRVRATRLASHGIKTIEDFVNTSSEKLSRIIGLKIETIEKLKKSALV